MIWFFTIRMHLHLSAFFVLLQQCWHVESYDIVFTRGLRNIATYGSIENLRNSRTVARASYENGYNWPYWTSEPTDQPHIVTSAQHRSSFSEYTSNHDSSDSSADVGSTGNDGTKEWMKYDAKNKHKKAKNSKNSLEDDDEEEAKGKRQALGIGLGVTFGILSLFIIAGIFYCFCIRKTKSIKTIMFCQSKVVPSTRKQNEYLPKNDVIGQETVDDPWILDRFRVSVDHDLKLGSGAFCDVYKDKSETLIEGLGKILGEAPICKLNPFIVAVSKFRDCECAVKVLPKFADETARTDFIQEINFMKTLRYHTHLVSMLGWVNNDNSPMLLVEYCKQGDLLHLLRSKKDEIIQGYENVRSLKIGDLVSFSWQISNGLEYLSSIGCIHRDIAARNVLVDELNVAKISDFGLCRLTNCLLYTGRNGRLPIKWMAPESLETYEYTEKSDVWSYGVLLYEIFSFGEVPYAAVQAFELLKFLKAGKRLTRPTHCLPEIYTLMLQCWKIRPSDRPTFTEICSTLIKIIENSTNNYGYVNAVSEYQETAVLDDQRNNDSHDG